MSALVTIGWRPRRRPLTPRALAIAGDDARRLLARLRHDPRRRRLRGVAGRDLVLLLGEADELPWAPGVVYLGVAPGIPSLLLPTALEATVPETLLEIACRRRALPAPVAVLPPARGVGPALVSVAAARRLDDGALDRYVTTGVSAMKPPAVTEPADGRRPP